MVSGAFQVKKQCLLGKSRDGNSERILGKPQAGVKEASIWDSQTKA